MVEWVSILGKDSMHLGYSVTHMRGTFFEAQLPSCYVLVTDTNIGPLYLEDFKRAFSGAGVRFMSYMLPPGDSSKSCETKAEVEDQLLAQSYTRDTVMLSLGGGVISDLLSFIAAAFMCGVRFLQILVTLLVMVDFHFSVGGKTAIDTPHGKIPIGAFWQPE